MRRGAFQNDIVAHQLAQCSFWRHAFGVEGTRGRSVCVCRVSLHHLCARVPCPCSQVWDDMSMINVDFSVVCPMFHVREINKMELKYLTYLDYNGKRALAGCTTSHA
jgi:hypothetical protein